MPLNIACWVTIFNMSCGFFAIMLEMANQSHAGLLMLLLAFVGDGLDGMLARKHNCASTFGENLDSLSDVIAFGVAPAFFALRLHPEWQIDMGAVIALMIYLVCGALRLARYDPRIQKDAFRGMPIPMAGLVLTGMSITAGGMPLFLLVPMTLGLLMVCDIPFMKLKFTGSKRLLPAFCVFSFAVLYLLTRDVAVATLGFAVPYALANLGLSLVNEARAATR